MKKLNFEFSWDERISKVDEHALTVNLKACVPLEISNVILCLFLKFKPFM